jgi:hypothetical protein
MQRVLFVWQVVLPQAPWFKRLNSAVLSAQIRHSGMKWEDLLRVHERSE